MTNNFDTETILQEMLAVLEKHAVPVKTVTLNLSFLSHDFEVTFPHIKEYKAGRFYRSLVINDIPTTLQIQRRIPFDDIEGNVVHLSVNLSQFGFHKLPNDRCICRVAR